MPVAASHNDTREMFADKPEPYVRSTQVEPFADIGHASTAEANCGPRRQADRRAVEISQPKQRMHAAIREAEDVLPPIRDRDVIGKRVSLKA